MITIESVLSKKNQQAALENLAMKKNGAGVDKVPLIDLREYWDANKERITEEILSEAYNPGLVLEYEIVNGKGKKRTVIRMNTIDRFITRLLAQKLKAYYDPMFLNGSQAYIDGRGTLIAAERAREYIEAGNEFVVSVDLKDFFDEIDLNILMNRVAQNVKDSRVLTLMREYLYCAVSNDGNVYTKEKGILQGCAMSPVLSNLYLHEFDCWLEDREYNWIRFADDISIYVDSEENGEIVFEDVCKKLQKDFRLKINWEKSDVYDAFSRRLLGYDFIKRGKKILIARHIYEKQGYYREWHPCVIEKVNSEYHILKNGTLNKKDYALLFENEDEKHHIPVEATEQINLYNEVVMTNSVIRTLSYDGIRLGMFDKYGNLLGYFVPEKYCQDSKTLLAQCMEYSDNRKRFVMAQKMEIAAIHNIRANLRYYRKEHDNLKEYVDDMNAGITGLTKCNTVDELLLVEARCRQKYYQAFNIILNNPAFQFETRSKRPPMDAINALISFGNTLLYNRIQQIIWKTSLDSRIGIFHAANKRHYSLNLDFADLFKPLTVDRVIFALINRGQLNEADFVRNPDGSVYLNEKGKRLFLESFEEKMESRLTVKNRECTYSQLIEGEVRKYKKHLLEDTEYKPYKYY